MLSHGKEAVGLASIEDQRGEDDRLSVDSDVHEDKPVVDVEWDFRDLQYSGNQGTSSLQAIRDLWTKQNTNEYSILVDVQFIVEDCLFSIPRGAELTVQLTETKEVRFAHTKQLETKDARLTGLVFEQVLLQRKTADTLGQAWSAIVSFPASLKRRGRFVKFQESAMSFK